MAEKVVLFLMLQQLYEGLRVSKLSCQQRDDLLPARVPRFAIHQMTHRCPLARYLYFCFPPILICHPGQGCRCQKLLNRKVQEEVALLGTASQEAAVLREVCSQCVRPWCGRFSIIPFA